MFVVFYNVGQKPIDDCNQTEMDTQNKETDQEETVDVGKST